MRADAAYFFRVGRIVYNLFINWSAERLPPRKQSLYLLPVKVPRRRLPAWDQKGTPVQIRDYPRSCKFHLPIYSGEKIVAFLSHWSCKDREGATTETSQKTCRHPQTFRLSGEKAIERILQDSFYYSIFSHARMFAQLNKKE